MGFLDRAIALVTDVAAAMDSRIKRLIDRHKDIPAAAYARLTIVDRQIIAVEIAAATHMDIEMARGTADIQITATRYLNRHFSRFEIPMDPATAGQMDIQLL